MADKITIFKEVFDYYYDGEITKEQLADLLLMHYETRWGNGVDIKEIEDKDLRKIWRILQYSVIKSTKNAKQYEKQQNKKSVLQEVTSTEFDIPKNPDNLENEIKEILSPSNGEDIDQPQPPRDNATESLKTPQNEGFEELLKIEKCRIDNIIDDFKAGGIRAKIQAPNRLKELTNTIHGKKYEQELKTYIHEQVYAMAV